LRKEKERTGTRVPRNTGSPPMISGSLTTRLRARRNSRNDSRQLAPWFAQVDLDQ
jgi:hypothetical protein